jgi:hypothetical protein
LHYSFSLSVKLSEKIQTLFPKTSQNIGQRNEKITLPDEKGICRISVNYSLILIGRK